MLEPNFFQQKNEEAQNFGDDEKNELCQTLFSEEPEPQSIENSKKSTQPNNTNTDSISKGNENQNECPKIEENQEKPDNEAKSRNADEQNLKKDSIEAIKDLAPEIILKENEIDDAVQKDEDSLCSKPIFDSNGTDNHFIHTDSPSHGDENDENIGNIEKSYTAGDTRSNTSKVP